MSFTLSHLQQYRFFIRRAALRNAIRKGVSVTVSL